MQSNAFTPRTIKSENRGLRRSVASLVELVDTTDPAFPFIAEALQAMKDAGVELDQAAVSIAVKLGKQKSRDSRPGDWKPIHAKPGRRSIVYYISRGDLIKIGTTTNPCHRFSSLMPDEILAFEPGDVELEAQRHRQFHWCRITRKGEYFRKTDGLLAHVAALREQHGEPDPAWPRLSTLGTGSIRTKTRIDLPEPQSDEMATATEGAKLLAMSASTIHGWVRRRLITEAGRDEKGRPMYFVDHMRFLIERNRAWMNRRPRAATDEDELQSTA